jgi:predicted phage-related endonuclease
MSVLALDALKISKRLQQTGLPEPQVEALVEALVGLAAEREQQATQRDLKEAEGRQEIRLAELARDMREIEANLKRDMKEMEANFKRDMKEMEVGLKRDMKEMETRLDGKIAELARDMKEMETGLKRDMKEMETRLDGKIAELARDMKEMDGRLRHDLEVMRLEARDLERRMTIKLGALMVVAVSVVAALVKLL